MPLTIPLHRDDWILLGLTFHVCGRGALARDLAGKARPLCAPDTPIPDMDGLPRWSAGTPAWLHRLQVNEIL